ncbi:MAG: hypothetical protein IT425_13540 [Pirellulales bacterium]|nr:hypothetical protein [Pirellulales bacterium]
MNLAAGANRNLPYATRLSNAIFPPQRNLEYQLMLCNEIRWMLLAATFTVLIPGSGWAEEALPLLMKDDFEHGFERWQPSDPPGEKPTWKIIEARSPGNHALRCEGSSKYQPKYRSPFNIAMLKDVRVSDFELTVSLQQTKVNAGPHRDLCLVWGYQDPSHFYYVHLGAKPDPHACQIFIVNEAERKMITVKKAKGTPWTKDWHQAKVVRHIADGTMEVYFDDMQTPLMTANDKTFLWGQVGLGTFDDHGNFDDFTLLGLPKRP